MGVMDGWMRATCVSAPFWGGGGDFTKSSWLKIEKRNQNDPLQTVLLVVPCHWGLGCGQVRKYSCIFILKRLHV